MNDQGKFLHRMLAGLTLLLLAACAGEIADERPAADDWAAKVARYGGSNLVNAPWLVANFCLQGGLYDSTPRAESGPYGFTMVDSLGLRHTERKALVVHDIARSEDGWWRITFGLGGSERHAFYINGRTRMASCGTAGLTNLRATFLPSERPFAGDSLAREVYRTRGGEFTNDVADQSDTVICGLAVSQKYGGWETSSGYLPYVREAKARGFTPQSCQARIDSEPS